MASGMQDARRCKICIFPSLLLNATPMELKINSLNSASAANAAYTYSGKISPKINDSLRDRDNKRETESGRGRER